jgi:hypothetical protein
MQIDQCGCRDGTVGPMPKRPDIVSPRPDQTTFLVVDDHGTGGIWMYVHARSAEEITDKFPRLTVFTEWRSWMTPDRLVPLVWNLEAYDLDAPPTGYLKILTSKPHAFFGAHGFDLQFEVDGDVVWADLVENKTGAVTAKYGRGDTEASAAERAMARWLEEQGR